MNLFVREKKENKIIIGNEEKKRKAGTRSFVDSRSRTRSSQLSNPKKKKESWRDFPANTEKRMKCLI